MAMRIDELVNAEQKVFIVNMRPKNGSEELEIEKRHMISTTCMSLKGRKIVQPYNDNTYPYKKNVNINENTYNSMLAKIDKVYKGRGFNIVSICKDFRNMVRQSIKDGTLRQNFGVDENQVRGMNFRQIIDCIFEQHKGKVDVELSGKSSLKITLTQKDFLEWIEAKSYLKEIESLDNVLNMVGVDNQNLTGKKKLPITFETKKFIKFDKGLSLVSFRLDYTSQEKREYTRRFLQKAIMKAESQGVEVVNLSYSKHFGLLNLLVPNERANECIKLFLDMFPKHVQNQLYSMNYHLDVEVEENIGQENCKSEWYYLLNGSRFNRIKESLEKEEGTFFGFPMYK
ncbi:hypothetical protein P4493_05130 [Bacillus thuringiensis]|jgi:hypothetical protein|uniref:Uncharacterized protein n=3 Tax=Bacillus thuringiensis TaxID=1428 RepID=A0A0B5NIV7_BACTU|nr:MULTISPECIES: hypothetical protein [Bacillus]EAO56427.1 hypothetical protein RBTH_07477 [Bacillus thuringiensis serovar israelensis ATCC 35646]MEC3431605.1 hypothetical protein [Bacillus cereus]MED1153622.1 hypothetical protein [Bacillus paranthracis]OUB09491.1 hypothetical protein BK708_33800 [Bacillus thuringiensis serovar yunnanensis]AFQ29947.1 hypothetical protein BTF1_29232 [Bacillus thuringiensis HD-789]